MDHEPKAFLGRIVSKLHTSEKLIHIAASNARNQVPNQSSK